MRSVLIAAFLLIVCAVAPALGQASEPVGPFVVDLRGLMAGLPTTQGWVPTLPAGTIVPSKGYGLDIGAHVYPLQWGPARVGVGAALTFARGTGINDTVEGSSEVVTRSSTLAPQISFNFGHRLGWSHLSFGYGAAKVSSDASGGIQPASTVDPGWSGAINFGGGARWFVTEHVGVGFDARWHRLGPRDASAPSVAAPRATLFHLAVGLAVR
jgi:opacity protein-like surface antigen